MNETLQKKIYKAVNAICRLMNDAGSRAGIAIASEDYCAAATQRAFRNGLQQALHILGLAGIQLVKEGEYLSKLITQL